MVTFSCLLSSFFSFFCLILLYRPLVIVSYCLSFSSSVRSQIVLIIKLSLCFPFFLSVSYVHQSSLHPCLLFLLKILSTSSFAPYFLPFLCSSFPLSVPKRSVSWGITLNSAPVHRSPYVKGKYPVCLPAWKMTNLCPFPPQKCSSLWPRHSSSPDDTNVSP